MEFDAGLSKLKEYVDSPKVGVANSEKLQEVINSYNLIKSIILAEDSEATVEIMEGALRLGTVGIRVITSVVSVCETEMFAQAIQKASNFSVCPTADDRVMMDVSFDGVIEYRLL